MPDGIWMSNDSYRTLQGNLFEQDARQTIGDAFEQQATAALPDMVRQAQQDEQQRQQAIDAANQQAQQQQRDAAASRFETTAPQMVADHVASLDPSLTAHLGGGDPNNVAQATDITPPAVDNAPVSPTTIAPPPAGLPAPTAPVTAPMTPPVLSPTAPVTAPLTAPAQSGNGYAFPVVGYQGKVQNHWGEVSGGSDLFAERGTPVVAMQGGKVIEAGWNDVGGNSVLVQGADGNQYYYAHFDQPPSVKVGQTIDTGTYLGPVGNTGDAKNTATHLHIGIGPSILLGADKNGGTGGNYNAVGLLQSTLDGTASSPTVAQPAAPTTAELSGAAKGSGQIGAQQQGILGAAAGVASWLGDQGQKALQSILVTEGGMGGAVGDNGQSHGPLQFYSGGQLANFARDNGMTMNAAAAYVAAHPVEAIQWAIGTPDQPGYLGRAILAGQKAGLQNADLATYAQQHGQVSVSPERAGQNFNALFGGGQSVMGSSANPAAATTTTAAQPSTTGPQTAMEFIQDQVNKGLGYPTDQALGEFLMAHQTQPAPPQPQSPIDTFKQKIGDAFSEILAPLHNLFGNVQSPAGMPASMQPTPSDTLTTPTLATRPTIPAPQQTPQPTVFDQAGQAVGNVIGGLGPGAGVLAQGQMSQGIGSTQAADVANQFRAENFPSVLDPNHPSKVFADLQAKYPTLNEAAMTPEDRQRYRDLALTVGGSVGPISGEGAFANDALKLGGGEPQPPVPPIPAENNAPLSLTPVSGPKSASAATAAAEPQADRAANILLEKFPEDVRPLLQDAADQFGQFTTQRRGVISDDQALANAAEVALGTSPEQWIKTPAGKAFNQEQAIALGNTLSQVGQEYDSMLTAVQSARTAGTVTAEQEASLADKALQFASLAGVRSGAAAEAGRALRSFRQELNGTAYGMDRNKAIDQAFKAIGTDKEKFAQWVEEFSKLPTDDAVGRYKMLQALHTPSAWDKISAWRYASMLSSWYTHLNNISSNVVQSTARPLRLASGGYLGEAGSDLRAMIEAVPDGAAAFMSTLRTGISPERLSQFENIRPRPLGEGPIGRTLSLPTDLMSAADDFFRTINYAGALRSGAVREAGGDAGKLARIMADPSAELIAEATQQAKMSTFQQDPGPFINNLMKLRSTPGPAGLAVQFFLPFVRTPANIFKAGFEMAGQPVTGLFKTGAAMRAGDVRTARIEAGQTAFAWLIGGAFAAKAMAGELSGDGPKDAAQRKLLVSQGWQPNSIKVGDQWVSYMNFGPTAVPLSVVANSWENVQDAGRIDPNSLTRALGGTMTGVGKSLTDASFLQQIGNTVKLVSGDTGALAFFQNTAAGAVGSMLPFGSALSSAAQVGDQVAREPTQGAPFLQGLGERIAGRVPGLRQNEPVALDTLGRVRPSAPATDPLALVARATQSRPDEMLATLSQAGLAVPEPPPDVTIGKNLQFKLQPEEQRQFRQFEGTYLQQALGELASDQDFRGAPIALQQKIIKTQIDKARHYAALQVADTIPDADLEQRITEYSGTQVARKQPLLVP